MASVGIYLNFDGTTEAAFEFYREVFGGDFASFMRMGEAPPAPGRPALSAAEENLIMHVELPILGGVSLMGTDMLESMGHTIEPGNNLTISLTPDSRDDVQRLFDALSEGGDDVVELQQMFWGLWGTCRDRFGTRWMFNFPIEAGAEASAAG